MSSDSEIKKQFGNIDIYIFDQLLKGQINPSHKILDAGCGKGRNLIYFLKNGYEVYAIDPSEDAIKQVKTLATEHAPNLPLSNFTSSSIENMPFGKNSFDRIICNAVLHFAQNKSHFEDMLFFLWAILKDKGQLFIRTATSIGIEDSIEYLGNGRYHLPDGDERYLIDLDTMLHYTEKLNAKLTDPIKTTNVQNQRCMSTWCLEKL